MAHESHSLRPIEKVAIDVAKLAHLLVVKRIPERSQKTATSDAIDVFEKVTARVVALL